MERKRNKTDIMHDMLRIIQENGRRIKKTHLMYKANLSHKQMELYLRELMSSKLIEKESPDKEFPIKVTSKGFDFMSKYAQVKEFEKTFGL